MKRVLTAAILAPLIAYVVLWARPAAFLVVLSAVALLCFYEYSALTSAYGIPKPGPAGYAAGLVVLLVPGEATLAMTVAALVALGLSLNSESLRDSLPRAAAFTLGIAYAFGTWRSAVPLRALSPYWLFFALVIAWVGDIAAYYVGRAIGRHKLAPRVSPGKSWEGAIASVIGSAVFGVVYLGRLIPSVSLAEAITLSAAGNIAGQLGDLCESALKRGAGVKDSSNLLPGHGGWLDRVDSSLFSVPTIYLLLSQVFGR